MLNWCSSLFIHSVNKYFLILYLLAVNFLWVSCVPACLTREGLTALCSRISFHGYSYREWPWKVDIMSPLAWRTDILTVIAPLFGFSALRAHVLSLNPAVWAAIIWPFCCHPIGLGSAQGTGPKAPVFWLLLLLWLVNCPFLTQSLISSISSNEIVLNNLVAFK